MMYNTLKYLLIFASCSVTGWILELFFRKGFGKARRFINPGFLFGPYLPIYGLGAVVLYILSHVGMNHFLRLIVIAIGMTVIEYVGGIFALKYYKIRLWDYRKEPLNYKGLICVKFTMFWVILGDAFNVFVVPIIDGYISWLYSNLQFSFFVGMFYGVFIIDVVRRLNLMAILKEAVEEIENKDFALNMDDFKLKICKERKKLNLGLNIVPTLHNIDVKQVVKDIEKEIINKHKKRKSK